MILLFVSFVAGALSVLAPCVLPLLPIIIGGAAQGHKRNPYIITASLAVAIVVFTFALKFSTLFINIPASFWNAVSGGIIIAFGLVSIFPGLWETINNKLGLSTRSDALLNETAQVQSRWGDVLMGLALGPVFSSCSPTYFIILATILPRSLFAGSVYLIAYALGLSLVLLLVSLLGQRFIKNARWAANPRGWFKRVLGVLFIIVGILIFTGIDKQIQTFLVEKGYFNSAGIEQRILEKTNAIQNYSGTNNDTSQINKNLPSTQFPRYSEIQNPSGFVNSDPITIGQFVGKKVILIDFMTYSCINCIRTFPYLNAWNEKYKDQGLKIIGIHTPEFAFEHKIENVREAMKQFGITFPVVLDNDYGTWNAFGNSYWPRKYLIDINGRIVFDHIGEGKYDETEKKIQELLAQAGNIVSSTALVTMPDETPTSNLSPETYLGTDRAQYYFPNGSPNGGTHVFTLPQSIPADSYALGGQWTIGGTQATVGNNASILYHFTANKVYLVLRPGSSSKATVRVYLDGVLVHKGNAGVDAVKGIVTVDQDRLYNLIDLHGQAGDHTLKLEFETPGTEVFAFTFG